MLVTATLDLRCGQVLLKMTVPVLFITRMQLAPTLLLCCANRLVAKWWSISCVNFLPMCVCCTLAQFVCVCVCVCVRELDIL